MAHRISGDRNWLVITEEDEEEKRPEAAESPPISREVRRSGIRDSLQTDRSSRKSRVFIGDDSIV